MSDAELYVWRHPALSQVLGVLGQRYPQDVDGAVSKVSRYVSNVVEADAGDEAHGGGASLGPGPCVSWDKALSSLLSSTFAGASLSHRAPLEVRAMCIRC